MNPIEKKLHSFYVKYIRPHIKSEIHRQRLKLLWFAWGYFSILKATIFPISTRFKLIWKFLQVDWNVLHAHRPCEIAEIARALSKRPARPGEVVVEAGCWRGGSSAKLSILCSFLGYELLIYDSFQGVEPLSQREPEGSYDFSREYSCSLEEVTNHIKEFGVIKVCQLIKGWFAETIALHPIPHPIRLVFIDCDLAKGTFEVLRGVIPSLVEDGVIFSQDYHIGPVKQLLHDKKTWEILGVSMPNIEPKCGNLALIHWPRKG